MSMIPSAYASRPLGRAGRLAPALLLLALWALPAAGQDMTRGPRDDAKLRMEYQAGVDIDASAILAVWANHFNALVVQDPQIQNIKIRFLTHVNGELAWATVKQLLDFHDIVIVEDQLVPGAPFMIRAHHRRNLPTKEPPPWPLRPGDQLPPHEELVTAVFQIQHGAGNSIFATVRGLLTRDPNRLGNILYVQGPELIIIVDLTSKVRYYGSVIRALDVPGPRREMRIISINYAPVQDLVGVITQVLTTLGGQGGGQPGGPVVVGAPGQANAQVIADQRTNQLIVSAFPIDFPLIERVISALDVRVATPTGRFHVYECREADAEDLASKLSELFTGQAPARRGAAGQQGQPAPAPTPSAPVVIEGQGGVGEVATRIVADERTNSLLIQAEEREYRQILQVLAQLDRKRRRVLIEAEVWEVSTPTDNLTIGFELAAITNAHEGSTRPIAATNFGNSTINVVNDAQGNPVRVGRVPNLGQGITAVLTRDTFDKLPVIMTAIANFEESRLVTRPFAVTNDNVSATFTISDRQPFLTTTVNNVASQQNVQFVDANSTLTIEPQVNSESQLTLKLTLEISSFSGRGSANLPPGTNTRRYEGEVTVPNNRYVVFGGLERDSEQITENKVPFLGDIPVLGHLFKTWTRTRSKTKVYVFIRPTILSDENFTSEARIGTYLREGIMVESGRDEWLPPIVPDRLLRPAGHNLQDEALEVFGTGSGNPFRSGQLPGED